MLFDRDGDGDGDGECPYNACLYERIRSGSALLEAAAAIVTFQIPLGSFHHLKATAIEPSA